MVESFITIQIEGVQEDGGEVRLNEFIEELTAVKNALRQTERLVLRSDASVIDYRVVKLSRNSPCSVTLGMTARDPVYKDAPPKIARRFTTSLRMVRKAHRFASLLDQRTLEVFQAVTAPTRKHVGQLTVIGDRNQAVPIDKEFDRSLQRLLQPIS